jgi:hypothetical protein
MIALILFFIGLSLIGSLIFNSPLYDETTLLLSIGIGCILLFAIKLSRKYLFDQLAIIIFFFIFFVFPRILMYLFAPDAVIFPFGDEIDAATINAGLLYVLIGTLLYIFGMMIADVFFNQKQLLSSQYCYGYHAYKSSNLILLFFIVIACHLYTSVILNLSPYGKMQADNYNTFVQLIKTLFEIDSAFLFVFASLLILWHKSANRNHLSALLVVILCYILLTSFGGSRVGAFRVLKAFVIILIVIHGDFRLKLSKYFKFFIILGAIGLILYPLATYKRGLITTSYHNQKYSIEESNYLEKTKTLIEAVSNRFGVIDYAILVITQGGNEEIKEKYMNFNYLSKNIINVLLPGIPFHDADIMTSRLIDVIYRGGATPEMYSWYNSEFWTLWGLAYVYYGWLGGLLAIFIAGIIIHSVYSIIILKFSGLNQFYLRIWFLSYIPMGTLGNMGFDDAFTTILFGLLQFIFYYYCLYFMKIVPRTFRILEKKPAENNLH